MTTTFDAELDQILQRMRDAGLTAEQQDEILQEAVKEWTAIEMARQCKGTATETPRGIVK